MFVNSGIPRNYVDQIAILVVEWALGRPSSSRNFKNLIINLEVIGSNVLNHIGSVKSHLN